MVIVLPNRDCLVYGWLYGGSYINMNKKKTISGWAIVVTWSDGNDEIITEIDDDTASYVDSFLNDYEKEQDED